MTPRMRSQRLRIRVATRRHWSRLQDDRDRGSITAYLLIMTVALVLLAGLVLDGGAALTAHGTAADTAQQAARAGADALDDTSLRATTPAGLVTNPAAARAAAAAVLGAADVTGEVTVTSSVQAEVLAILPFATFDIQETATAPRERFVQIEGVP